MPKWIKDIYYIYEGSLGLGYFEYRSHYTSFKYWTIQRLELVSRAPKDLTLQQCIDLMNKIHYWPPT